MAERPLSLSVHFHENYGPAVLMVNGEEVARSGAEYLDCLDDAEEWAIKHVSGIFNG